MSEDILHVGAVRTRATGSGSLRFTLYSLDETQSQVLIPLILSATTNIQPTLLANFSQQRVMLKLTTTSLDEHFTVRRIQIFAKPIASGYPQ
jgi:hypothetical protein